MNENKKEKQLKNERKRFYGDSLDRAKDIFNSDSMKNKVLNRVIKLCNEKQSKDIYETIYEEELRPGHKWFVELHVGKVDDDVKGIFVSLVYEFIDLNDNKWVYILDQNSFPNFSDRFKRKNPREQKPGFSFCLKDTYYKSASDDYEEDLCIDEINDNYNSSEDNKSY